jgi:cytochrome c-type biogenesis protein CcmF
MTEREIGPYRLRFDEFKLEEHMTADQRVSVGATLTITRENQVQVLTPWLRVSPEGMISSLPIAMGNGRDLLLEQISVNSDQVRVRVTGLNLPVAPARAVLTVSTKPAIALVWLGTIVMVLGGCLAMLRRRLELLPVAVPGERRLPAPGQPRVRGWDLPGWREVFTRS